MNLALSYPYLAPQLDKYVFDMYVDSDLAKNVGEFASALVRLGIRKLYPDAIAHAFYYSLKHGVKLDLTDKDLIEIIVLDDCIANVMLLEYANQHNRSKVVAAIKKRATAIKKADTREKDKNWLLIYQVWSIADLNGNGQTFLANLKAKDFKCVVWPLSNSAQPV